MRSPRCRRSAGTPLATTTPTPTATIPGTPRRRSGEGSSLPCLSTLSPTASRRRRCPQSNRSSFSPSRWPAGRWRTPATPTGRSIGPVPPRCSGRKAVLTLRLPTRSGRWHPRTSATSLPRSGSTCRCSRRTRSPACSPTSSPAASPTASTWAASTTPWTRRARRRWRHSTSPARS